MTSVRRLTTGILAGLLLFLISVASPIAMVSSAVVPAITDTDTYIRLVSPMAKDPDVQREVVDSAVSAIDRATEDHVPSALGFLRDPTEKVFRASAEKVVASDWFASLWVNANRVAHRELVEILRGGEDSLIEDSGDLTLNLSPVLDKVVEAGGTIGPIDLPIDVDALHVTLPNPVISADDLRSARSAYQAVLLVNGLLPWCILIIAALAVALSPRRHRTVLLGLSGVAAASLLAAAGTFLAVRALAPQPDTMQRALLRRPLMDLSASVTDRLLGAALTAITISLLWAGVRTLRLRSNHR